MMEGKAVIVSTDPLGLIVDVTYNGLIGKPVDAGSYEVITTINDANYVGTDIAILTINPAQMTISANNVSKIYGEDDPEFTYHVTSGNLFGK